MQHALRHFLRMNLMYHMPFVLSALGPLKPDETSFMLLGSMKSLKSHVWSCIELMIVPASAGTSWNQTHERLPWYSSSFALEKWWDMPALVNLSCLCFCAPQQLVFYRFLLDISSNSLISESTRQSARRESPLEDGPSGGFRVQVANDQAVQHTSQHIQCGSPQLCSMVCTPH